jgi:hypothetical protein
VLGQYELSIAADILATKADDKAKREELYHSLWGVRGLLSYMQLNVNTAHAIKTPRPPEDDSTTDYATPQYDYYDGGFDDEGFPRANNENDY